ncbi:MAG TPA: Crp/Fnr family transcriptional regulator [Caulobacter sp.]|nr:Crp/Fnr family transcriptional regulator [Caulobacter sp.]
MIGALVLKMSRRDDVSAEERRALEDLLEPERHVAAGASIIKPGDRPTSSTLLLSGYAARYSFLEDGGRQLTELNLAGDFIDLHSFLMKQMDHGVLALSDCVIAGAPHVALRRITEEHPHLTRLLWLETVIDAAIHRQWLVAMGRQNAISRLAHLICEIYLRLEAAGLAEAHEFSIPLTQTDLSDMLGVTAVHVNRVLKDLRGLSLIEWKGARVEILDWGRLCHLAQFDGAYLRLQREPV